MKTPVIHEGVGGQYAGVEYGDEVAEYEVGVHYARLVVVVASGLGSAQVVVVDLCVAVASRVGKLLGMPPFTWARVVAVPVLIHMSAEDVSIYASSRSIGREALPLFFLYM